MMVPGGCEIGPVRVLLLLIRGVFLDRAELAAEVFGMDRSNVANVFDAGATEQGRPYFVMEHVPLNDYAVGGIRGGQGV
ncbi:MAG: hypothetical protein V3W34_16635 [Phycisphaerae bacterium]